MDDQFLTVQEAADAIHESRRTVERWIYEGVLPVERVGPSKLKRVRIRLSTLQRMYPSDLVRIPTQTIALS